MNENIGPGSSKKNTPSEPLTRQEIHDAANARISLITKEFTDGFNFLRHYPKSVTFFGSARFPEHHPYYVKAQTISERIVNELHYSIFTGGGPGIMEAANRGAFEAGGDSLGLTIELPDHQVTNKYLTKYIDLHYFFSRKVCLSFSAEAYLFFPGGIGTLDEFFEILTLVQTKKIESVPIILVGSDFWKKVEYLLKDEMLSRETIDTNDLKLYTITDNDDEIIQIIKKAPVRNGIKFKYSEPAKTGDGLFNKKCIPCEKDTPPLDHNESKELISEIKNWKLTDNKQIERKFDFPNFEEAIAFVDDVAEIAKTEGHHPDICVSDYKYVTITLSTHSIGGLSENDFIMASKINTLV